MLILFWCATLGLLCIAYLSFLPGISKLHHKGIFIFLLPCLIYPLYFYLGSSSHLQTYYTPSEKKSRHMQIKIRPLLSAMKKQEGRLQLKLNENPNDRLSQALLLELLGVEALHKNEHEMALQCWDQALKLLPAEKEYESIKHRIIKVKDRVLMYHMPK